MSQCQAIVADYENGTRYNLRRAFTAPRRRQCKRSAKTEMLGPLGHTRHFCATHAGLAEEGLLTVSGYVEARQTIRDVHAVPSLAVTWRQQNGWQSAEDRQ